MTKNLLFRLVSGLHILSPMVAAMIWVNAQDLPPEVIRYADMVLHNGQVLTMDQEMPPFSVTEAIAIRDGRIMAVGEDSRILQMAGPDTERVDLAGRTLMPGFVDTHSHPNSSALSHHSRDYTAMYVRFLREQNIRFIVVNWESVASAGTHPQGPTRIPGWRRQLLTRKAKDGRVFGARERLDRATALLMMTRWGAEYVLREDELGSLEAGKLADFVILEKNPLDPAVPDEALSQIRVLAAVVGGELEYGSLNPSQ